jgi:hypothetical protein
MPTALLDFAKYVRPEVPGCPEIMILDAIKQAGIEFCERTKIAKEVVTITTVADEPRYALTTEEGTTPDMILVVKREDAENLDPSSHEEFTDEHFDRDSGEPRYYYLDDNEIVLGMIPSGVEDLDVTVKLRPTEEATTLPDVLANKYKRKIACGAKARLMVMAGKPWSNPAAAQFNESEFQKAIDDANLREAKGNTNKRLRVTGHYF